MTQLEIKEKDGHVYWYASIHDGCLRLEKEFYGNGEGSRSSEFIYTIEASEFPKICEKYGLDGDSDIMSVLESLVKRNRAGQFNNDIVTGFIEVADKFSWVSFND